MRLCAFAFLSMSLAIRLDAQTCKTLEESKPIPAVDVLFDSAALANALPAADTSGPREMVFTLITGARPLVSNMDSTVMHPVNDAAIQALETSSRPGSRSFAPAFRVRVVLDQVAHPASLTIEKSVLCGPEMIGTPAPIRTVTRITPAGSGPPPQPRPVTARLRIGRNGQVMRVELGAGSGDRELDQALKDGMMRNRFKPALLDGRPIEVWTGNGKLEIAR